MSIEAGRYTGRAIAGSLEVGETTNGSPQVGCRIEILNQGYEGETVIWYGVLKGGATPITLEALRAMGWQGESFADQTGLGDAEVTIGVKYESWEGEERMKVNVWGKGVMKKKLEGSAVSALDARLRGEILKSKQASGGSGKPAAWTPPATAPIKEWDGQGKAPPGDDIPF